MFTTQEFRLETGYGQTLTVRLAPNVPGLVLLEIEQSEWDDHGNEIGVLSVEAVLEMMDLRALAVALYQAHQSIDSSGEVAR